MQSEEGWRETAPDKLRFLCPHAAGIHKRRFPDEISHPVAARAVFDAGVVARSGQTLRPAREERDEGVWKKFQIEWVGTGGVTEAGRVLNYSIIYRSSMDFRARVFVLWLLSFFFPSLLQLTASTSLSPFTYGSVLGSSSPLSSFFGFLRARPCGLLPSRRLAGPHWVTLGHENDNQQSLCIEVNSPGNGSSLALLAPRSLFMTGSNSPQLLLPEPHSY
ncbi:hypothetical protein BDW62DRAFT_108081 [Aspergillus aurantiobrunneus]